MKKFFTYKKINFLLLSIFLLASTYVQARLGGGGGSNDGGGSSDGDGIATIIWIVFKLLGFKGVVIVVVLYLLYQWYSKKNKSSNTFSGNNFAGNSISNDLVFPDGLNSEKVKTAFFEMQNAWQNQDLSSVRKWMSDGLYQKFSVQLKMMEKLAQHNKMDNIRIQSISVANVFSYNDYQIVDVQIDFMLNDTFYSDKYKSMNESFNNDFATEYYSFIKKGNKIEADSNLYSGNNCPNCGATLNINLGDICRCPNCKTLTNNPEYDWVLCEITQGENYNDESNLNYDERLKELTKFDPDFNIQSLEDIASNVTMQIFDVLTGGDTIKLDRFAHKDLKDYILSIKESSFKNVLFDRLYLNEVTTQNYSTTEDNNLEISFYVEACGKRVRLENDKLKTIDDSFITFQIYLSLLKGVQTKIPQTKDVVYSYECSNCGAPYDDSTHDTCNYCDTVVVDESKNWILSKIKIGL